MFVFLLYVYMNILIRRNSKEDQSFAYSLFCNEFDNVQQELYVKSCKNEGNYVKHLI